MAKVSADEIRAWAAQFTDLIPGGFFVRMAERESGLNPNNVTAESNGTTSIGLFQVNAAEAVRAGVDPANLKDPVENTRAIVWLMDTNLRALADRYAFTLAPDAIPDDIWYYLAASHNAGLGRVEQWLDEQGGRIDWAETKGNHATFATIARGYADYIGRGGVQDMAGRALALAENLLTDDTGDLDATRVVVVLAIAVVALLFLLRGHAERWIPL